MSSDEEELNFLYLSLLYCFSHFSNKRYSETGCIQIKMIQQIVSACKRYYQMTGQLKRSSNTYSGMLKSYLFIILLL